VGDEIRGIVVARRTGEALAACTGPAFDAVVERVSRRELDPYRAAEELLPSSP
jgi:hypothetical protein